MSLEAVQATRKLLQDTKCPDCGNEDPTQFGGVDIGGGKEAVYCYPCRKRAQKADNADAKSKALARK